MSFRVAGARGLWILSKVSTTWGFCSISTKDGRRGTFQDDLQRRIFRGRRSTKDMFMREVGRSGRWFPERGYILEYQKCRFAKMIVHDRCSISYDLAASFRGRRSTLDRWSRKIAKRIEKKRWEMLEREKVGKSRNTVFFQWCVAQEGRKVGSLKRRVRSQLAIWEMKNCTPLWREAHFQVKMYKTPQRRTLLEVELSKKCTPLWREAHFQVKMYKSQHGRTTFGSWDVEKVHAVVARSTFPSQNVQNTPWSDHFWKLRSRKSARRCGAKQISKSKCSKH